MQNRQVELKDFLHEVGSTLFYEDEKIASWYVRACAQLCVCTCTRTVIGSEGVFACTSQVCLDLWYPLRVPLI